MDNVENRRDEQEQEFQRFGGAAYHAGDNAGNQQAFNLMAIFRTRAVIHRQRCARQAAEECRHFTL